MRTYSAFPSELVEGWGSRIQTHPAGQRIDFHYHDADEWLELMRGEMTFYSLAGEGWRVHPGDAFHIPRGEVHRVDIGDRGVEYRMYAQVEIGPGFSNALAADELAMLRTNLEFPEREENADGHAAEFFAAHLSDALSFCRADGSVVGKEAFAGGFAARGRASAGSVCVLNRTPKGVLLSTVVTVGARTAAAKAFLNVRFFARDDSGWKCRMWINYPYPL